MTDLELLIVKIERATKVLATAEEELQSIVQDHAAAPAEQEATAAEAVREASSRLGDAEAKLIELEGLLTVAKIEQAKTKVMNAKVVISEAEEELDRVINQIVVGVRLQETSVAQAVESAFAKLRAAKQGLVDLERSLAADRAPRQRQSTDK